MSIESATVFLDEAPSSSTPSLFERPRESGVHGWLENQLRSFAALQAAEAKLAADLVPFRKRKARNGQ